MKYMLSFAKNIAERHLKVHSVDFIGSGNHSEAFCVNGEVVIKLPKHQKASNCLKAEIHVLRALEQKLPLEISKVPFDGTFSAGNESFACSISKRLGGRSLSKAEFLAVDNLTTMKNAELIAKFLFRLHHEKLSLICLA